MSIFHEFTHLNLQQTYEVGTIYFLMIINMLSDFSMGV